MEKRPPFKFFEKAKGDRYEKIYLGICTVNRAEDVGIELGFSTLEILSMLFTLTAFERNVREVC